MLYQLVLLLYLAIPIALIVLAVDRVRRYRAARRQEQQQPGSVPPGQLRSLKQWAVLAVAAAVVLAAVVVGFAVLLFMAIAFM